MMFNKQQTKRRNGDLEQEDLLYGTPLPPIEDQSSLPRKQELDKTVRDENGRRRLHGAFSGGFSAGYWNTVGSKEGWTPSQFVSRKNERSKMHNYKPEDFMDDEDFGEFGIAPKQVKAKDKFFSTTESFAGFRDNLSKASTIDDVLKDVVTINSVSIGVRILKRMKKNAIQKLSKEGYLNSDQWIFPLEFDEHELKSFFLNPKKNLNGLGYKGLTTNVNFGADAKQEQSAKTEISTTLKDGKKLKISGEAFGYGALDEDDGFEAEVYTFDDLSQYDYTLSGVKKQQNKTGRLFNSILSDSHLMDDFIRFDEDFCDKLNENRFKIKVPPDWEPSPPGKTKKKIRKSRWDNENKKDEDHKQYQKRSLDTNRKAEILGEDEGSLEREQIDAKLRQIKEEQEKLSLAKEQRSIDDEEFKSLENQVTVKQENVEFKKPLTGFFASKFIQATNTPLDVLKPGLTKIENLPQISKQKTSEKEEIKSIVGKSNREIYQWHPHKLLCKRFNVPHPYPLFPDVVGVLAFHKSKQATSIVETFFAPTITVNQAKIAQQPTKKEIVPEIIEEFKKPDMNLFKAVFDLSDDDDGGDLSDIEEIGETKTTAEDGREASSQENDRASDNKGESKSIEKLSDELIDKPNELPILTNPPKIVFNKSFVKKSVDSVKVDAKDRESKPKKVARNFFEDEIDLSEDEGVNLLVKKRTKTTEKSELDEPTQLNQSYSHDEPEQKLDHHEKNDNLDDSDRKLFKSNDKKSDQTNLVCQNLALPEMNGEFEKVCESNKDLLDNLVDEIMKPESKSSRGGSYKKKRKKNKEHKKHKKKHKRSSRNSD